jgi:hypothetical protein
MTDTLTTATNDSNEAAELDEKAREYFRACGRKAKGHKGRRLFRVEARRIRAIGVAKQKAAREAKEAEKGLEARQDEIREAAAAPETL